MASYASQSALSEVPGETKDASILSAQSRLVGCRTRFRRSLGKSRVAHILPPAACPARSTFTTCEHDEDASEIREHSTSTLKTRGSTSNTPPVHRSVFVGALKKLRSFFPHRLVTTPCHEPVIPVYISPDNHKDNWIFLTYCFAHERLREEA